MNEYLDGFVSAYAQGSSYTFDNKIMLNWYPGRIMALCPNKGKLLELGLGHGFTTDRFSNHFSSHVVIEGSSAVIEQFHSQFPNCKAEVINSYFEDFDTVERFDVIVMGFVLEHVTDPYSILQSFKKFLAPGGRFFVTVPNAESLHRRFGNKAGLLDDVLALSKCDEEQGHLRFYTLDSLTSVLHEAGYRIVRKEGLFLKVLTTAQLQLLNLNEKIIEAMCLVGIDYPELSNAILIEAEVAND